MAQTGFTPIQLYFSSTPTNTPLAANLASGELAINITDGKLFYKDNANAVQVIGWKVVPATAGGTGQTSYAIGDLLYADTTTTLAKLADVATGNALISGGVSTAPSWGKIGLTTHVSGVLPVANGGTNASVASITAFNNITGYTASGATGTTSTNLVFSTSPSITTPTLVGNVTLSTGNLVVSSGKGIDFTAGGVANGVAYLDGSKLLASFSSNLKFDGTTLDVGASGVNSRLGVKAASGGRAMLVQRSNGDNYFYTDNDNAVSTGANGADTVLFINKNTSTGRSINAAGTLNALGTDYAEYMTKAGDFVLVKGDVCGINANGKLTNVFSEAVSFVVKSTNPSFVGGDVWGNEEALGLVAPEPVSQKENQSDDDFALVKSKYDQEKTAFDALLETARQTVDRIAFAGQVPVNITGAVPGQYIVPVDDNGAIKPTAVDEANMTLAMYMKAVGKVIAIETDGRAKIIVKTA